MVPPVGKHPYSLIRDDLRILLSFFSSQGATHIQHDRRARLYLKSLPGRTRAHRLDASRGLGSSCRQVSQMQQPLLFAPFCRICAP
jgi:hypothetical protein